MRDLAFTNLWADDRGTTAVEFAILAPALVLLLIGTIYICFGLFLVGSLHYAVEEGARCASVKTTVCSDEPTIVAYTQRQYFGPTVTPTFTYATGACGNIVSGSATYVANLGVATVSVPVTASACFP
jgi:Flp pilus assembly protein TadG